MARFAARRLLQALLTLLIATFVFFAAVTLLPGDPVRALFGFRGPPPDVYARVVEQFHLDEPFLTQYTLFISDLARGNFGHSYPANPFGVTTLGPSIRSILAATLPTTAIILGAAFALQVLVGMAVGVWAAVRGRGRVDTTVYAVAVLLVALPVIVSAIALQAFVGYELRWLPATWRPGAGWTNYILPVATLAAGSAAYLLLLARTELHATLRRPFVHAATARGISRRRVVAIHALRPSLVPIVTFVTANLGNLVAGLIVVEGIFGVPGAGGALFRALQSQDRATIVVMIILVLTFVIVANALTDILYGVVDPRIRLEDR